MSCPSILELTTTDLAADQALRRHVESCVRCQVLLRAWDSEAVQDDELVELDVSADLTWKPRADPASAPALGAIHTVSAPTEDTYLLALVCDLSNEQATVFPISTEAHQAGDWDVILDTDVLGYVAMVEAWNPIDVLVEQLEEQLATTDPDPYLDLYDRALAGKEVPLDVPDGPPLDTEDDPRHLFREYERERVRPYAEAARVVGLGDSLGEIIQVVRGERERDPEDLATAAGIDIEDVTRLEENRLDLAGGFAVKSFASLISELEIPVSEAFFARVENAVYDSDRSVAADKEAVYGRFQLIRKRRQRGPDDKRRQRAKAWVERLREEMVKRR